MRPGQDRSIAIIGGGISGLTTAVLLQTIGYRTVLYTRAVPAYGAGDARPAEFATPHAAASILPHSVASPDVARWTGISQAFFRALGFRACCGVRSQVHYEIFEDPVPEDPPYAGSVDNFERLTAGELREKWVPRRSGADATHGWKFDAWFCDAPEYLAYLYAFYGEIGGLVREAQGDGSLAACLELDHDFYVNCAGIAAHSLLSAAIADRRLTDAPAVGDFDPLADAVPPKLIRGHYLRVDSKHVPVGNRARFFSYNYKPVAGVYRTASGAAADVYCYPRSDGWILGGSRQEGRLDEGGNWAGERTVGEETEFRRFDGGLLGVPAAILRLNADILLRMTDGALDLARMVRDDPAIVAPGLGYRFVRDSETDSVRIGCSRVRFGGAYKYVLHNYGHGGSGFTLSWGCALDVLRLIGRMIGPAAAAGSDRFTIHYAATRQLLAGLAGRLIAEGA